MHIKLDPSYVEPDTRTPLPDAVLVISDTEFRLRAGDTRVIVAIYAAPELIDRARPIREYPVALGPEERDSQLPALLQALYSVLLDRPEYTGSSLVP